MKVNEKCECVDCDTCKGSGTVWVSGDHMSAFRFNDEGDMESCPECGGEGITSMCLKCWMDQEDDEDY